MKLRVANGFWVAAAAIVLAATAAVGSADKNAAPDTQLDAEVAQQIAALKDFENILPLAHPQPQVILAAVSHQSGVDDLDAFGAEQIDQMSEAFAATAGSDGVLDIPMKLRDIGPEVASLPKKRGRANWQCLAEAIYFEARSESELGQRAVAEVILNRVASRRYPDTICGVVQQGAHRRHKCQFSYNCDGVPERITEPRAYNKIVQITQSVLRGEGPTLTNGATHYHTDYVSPHWARVLTPTARIGTHVFYRESDRSARR